MAIVSKFFLMIYIARYMDFESLGIFGLFQGSVVVMSKVAGFGLSFFGNRELVGSSPLYSARIMRNQYSFYILIYVLLLPGIILAWWWVEFDIMLLISFFIIGSLEHFSYEMTQSFFALQRPIAANILLFVRTGLWVFPVIGLGLYSSDFRHLNVIWICWISGILLSLVFVACKLRKWPWKQVSKSSIDYKWIRRGLITSFPIYLGMMGMVGALYLDRYIISLNLGLKLVGVYSLFWSFSNAVQTIVTSSIHMVANPKMIHHRKKGDDRAYWKEVENTCIHVSIITVFVCSAVGLGVWLLAPYLNESEYVRQNIAVLCIMLLATWMRLISDVAYYALYASHRDRSIMVANLTMLFVSLTANLALIPLLGLMGAGVAMVISAGFLLTIQWTAVWRTKEMAIPATYL
jgi:O-antigen/teichoic acid export membrane protein